MKLQFSKKTYFSIIIFLLISAGLIGFVIFPLISDIKEDSQNLFREKEAQMIFSEEKINLQNFRDISEEIEANLEKVDNLFVDPEIPAELVTFSSFLEKTAKASGISIEIPSVSPGIEKKDGEKKQGQEGWSSLIFNIETVGPFPSLLRFVEKLENSSYLIEIDNINVKRLSEGATGFGEIEDFSSENVISNLTLKIYTK